MEVSKTPFKDLLIIKPRVHKDGRGCFLESWNKRAFEEAGVPALYVQDNQSRSAANVLRGLHLQLPPHAQGKLVKVLRGAVLDIALDLRKGEKTFGKHFSMILREDDHTLLYIPPGFAHGFRTLEDDTTFLYKCTHYYNRESERAILWNDPALGIDWGTTSPLLSQKDRDAIPFSEFESPF